MFKLRRVDGHSMEPNLRSGQLVVVATFLKPKIDSIVVVESRNKEVIKRVSRIEADQIFLSGDNPGHDVGWVSSSALVGRLIHAF